MRKLVVAQLNSSFGKVDHDDMMKNEIFFFFSEKMIIMPASSGLRIGQCFY